MLSSFYPASTLFLSRKGLVPLLGSCLLAMSGCVHEPVVQTSAIPIQQAHGFLTQRQQLLQQQPALQEAPIPQQWWNLLNDPVLNRLQAQLVHTNLDEHLAVLRIEESQATLGQISSALKPQLSLDADYSRSAISQYSPLARLGANYHGHNLWNMGLQSSWELDLWGYLRHQKAAAQAGLEAQYFDADALHVSLSADLARSYLLLRNVQIQQLIVEQIQQLDQQQLNIIQKKQQNGVATQGDVAAVQSGLIQTRQHMANLQQQESLLKNNLAQLLGLPPQSLDQQLGNPQAIPPSRHIPIGLASDFVQYRPDILAADARLRAAIENIHVAKADFYPRIGISAQLGKQALSLTDFGQWDSRTYGIGPTLHLPIFDGGRLKSTLLLSETRQKMAAINYQKTVLNAWYEIDHAFIDYRQVQDDATLLQQQMAQQNVIHHTAVRQQQQGVADQAQVLLTERQILQLQLALTENQTANKLSIVALYRALGGEGASRYARHLCEEHP